jgi:hypothetical protein
MTQRINQAIEGLQAELEYHQEAAARVAQAISNLRSLLGEGPTKPGPKPRKAAKVTKGRKAAKAAKPTASAKPAPAAKGRKGKKASLKRALQYVLESHRKAKVGGVSARQLFDDVQRAGFRFGGTNRENNMNYLYKTLRKNKSVFKRVGDGMYGIA